MLDSVFSMPPGNHRPRGWRFIKVMDDDGNTMLRIFSFMNPLDDWRLSSKVISLLPQEDHFIVITQNGSGYYLDFDREVDTNIGDNIMQRYAGSYESLSGSMAVDIFSID